MALRIEDEEIERLIHEIRQVTGESKVEIVKVALRQRLTRLRAEELERWLKEEMWPSIPPELRNQRISKEFFDALYE